MPDLDTVTRVGLLYDFYGPLLTVKQRQLISMYYHQDLSLGEIAGEMGTSRQAVYDTLKRTCKALEGYEAKLGLLQKFKEQREKVEQVRAALLNMAEKCHREEIIKVCQMIDNIID